MRRIAACLCLVATISLLPVEAEAARFRFGGRSAATPAKVDRDGVIAFPGVAKRNGEQAATTQPERVPFPPAAVQREEQPPLRLSASSEPRKAWCGSEIVVGGFCLMN
ncbi:hypothetical protein [Bosea sp. (in: a-proteobacteria)]|uniref:hypothetical protein n=1 Tax=Bosea sp. (in: a-proteobacteria) TaxID=1871050 RepID=UPI002632B742|nr:hypothetical protein [Bosea sp. (in: a-proteobacteria)]MCO5091880.1 hypothetical protein [Bosea sp. (in: a-proteobacteria)]